MKSARTKMPLAPLKPCPFCGGEPQVTAGEAAPGESIMFVRCKNCGAQSAATRVDGFEGVVCEALWNKRQGETEEAMRKLAKDLEREME